MHFRGCGTDSRHRKLAIDASALKRANLILVMEEGRVIERGTHEELMQAGGVLRNGAAGGGRDSGRFVNSFNGGAQIRYGGTQNRDSTSELKSVTQNRDVGFSYQCQETSPQRRTPIGTTVRREGALRDARVRADLKPTSRS
jgi:hypothetical protein